MNIEQMFNFRSAKLPTDGGKTFQAYLMWIKCHSTIWLAFPQVNRSAYYKRIQLYGIQNFWTTTWFDRYRSSSKLGESTVEVNECWASLLLFHLDMIWPQLDTISDRVYDQLSQINKFTNRIKGAKQHGLGFAARCLEPDRIEGFIDLYLDIGSNDEITAWAARDFLPKHLGVKLN